MEILNIGPVFPTTPEVLKQVLRKKSYSFIKLPLVRNNIRDIFWEEGAAVRRGQRAQHAEEFADASFLVRAY